jgi:hypothetical protein
LPRELKYEGASAFEALDDDQLMALLAEWAALAVPAPRWQIAFAHRAQSSSASRFTAGAFAFFILSQSRAA